MPVIPHQSVSDRRLRVFLCHSSGDKPVVRDLYRRLKTDGFAPWLDEEELLPGQDWREEIPKAVRTSDVVVVCISQKSVTREGFLQREIRVALDAEEEKPEGTIFIVPLRLEEVEVPSRLRQWHWADWFREGGYQRLVKALKVRADAVGVNVLSEVEEAGRKAGAELKASKEEAAPKQADVPPASPALSTIRENAKDGLKYVWIPPGTFMMGCSPGDTECFKAEKPAHQVTLSKGFWMGQTEVTVGAYKRFTRAAGRQMPTAPDFNTGWADDAMPIVMVTWEDARDYCRWAGGRLPTEGEWEYAARGGSTESRYGNLDEIAWYLNNSGGHAHQVAQKRANGFGLFDVLGNVWEWVNDWYDENYYQNSSSQDPPGPANGQLRVLRGGSWVNFPVYVRVSFRSRNFPLNRSFNIGFRCVRDAERRRHAPLRPEPRRFRSLGARQPPLPGLDPDAPG